MINNLSHNNLIVSQVRYRININVIPLQNPMCTCGNIQVCLHIFLLKAKVWQLLITDH